MTAQPGISTYLANSWLGMLGGTAFTAPATLWAKLHIGQPGAAGTANPSAVTTRLQVHLNAAASGQITITTTYPVFSMTATETLTHVSLWDASTSGNFLLSGVLSTATPESNGNTYTFNLCTVSFAAFLAA